MALLEAGSHTRRMASTRANAESSRSHAVFTCVVEQRVQQGGLSHVLTSRLNLVDLAGSERQRDTGAAGEQLREACTINRSLSALGHVIMALVEVSKGRPRHVPYRDSKLSFLLQDSLGGNSRTVVIACVATSLAHVGETLSTLKFAANAKCIRNCAIVNEEQGEDPGDLRDGRNGRAWRGRGGAAGVDAEHRDSYGRSGHLCRSTIRALCVLA